VKEGQADRYKEACRPVIDVVDKEEPRVHFFGFYLDDEGTEATTVQIHPDPESMLLHMQLVEDHIRVAHEFLDFTKMAISIYGTPNEAVLEMMRELSGTGVPITIKPLAQGVNRLQTATV